jgi:hypothetical protein
MPRFLPLAAPRAPRCQGVDFLGVISLSSSDQQLFPLTGGQVLRHISLGECWYSTSLPPEDDRLFVFLLSVLVDSTSILV